MCVCVAILWASVVMLIRREAATKTPPPPPPLPPPPPPPPLIPSILLDTIHNNGQVENLPTWTSKPVRVPLEQRTNVLTKLIRQQQLDQLSNEEKAKMEEFQSKRYFRQIVPPLAICLSHKVNYKVNTPRASVCLSFSLSLSMPYYAIRTCWPLCANVADGLFHSVMSGC